MGSGEAVGIELITRSTKYRMNSAGVSFKGMSLRANINPDTADRLIAQAEADGVKVTTDEQGYYHTFGDNDYGSRYLPELVTQAQEQQGPAPRLRAIGKQRVSRYIVHTIWAEEV